MKMGKRLHSQKGFTLAELLMVVAIIGILSAVSFVAVTPRIESTRQTRLDKTAETMYAAAQARLSEVYAFGNKEDLKTGTQYSASADNALYAITNADSNAAYQAIIGSGAFADFEDKTWVIEYDALNGIVLNVFYSDNQGAGAGIGAGAPVVKSPLVLVAHAETNTDPEPGDNPGDDPGEDSETGGDGAGWSGGSGWAARASLRGSESERTRLHVGWYGYGGPSYATPGLTNRVGNAAVSVKLHNEETLYAEVEITIPEELFDTTKTNTLKNRLSVSVAIQDVDTPVNQWASPVQYIIGGASAEDITQYKKGNLSDTQRIYEADGESSIQIQKGADSQYRVKFNFLLDQLDTSAKTGLTLNKLTGITPGANVNFIIKVASESGEIPEIADFDMTNSLFASRATVDGKDTIYIEYGRHLQNLNNTGTMASGFAPASAVSAVQVADILLTDGDGAGADNHSWGSVYGTKKFVPIENTANLTSYDGQGYAIYDLDTGTVTGDAGLFGTFAGTTLKDITLCRAKLDGSGDAGALAGKITGAVKATGNQVIGAEVKGTNAGGLIGGAGSAALGVTNCEAIGVKVSGTNAGGLIGSAAGETTVSGSSVWLRTSTATGDKALTALGMNQSDTTPGTVETFLNGTGVAGGLVGASKALTVDGSYAATVIKGGTHAGGLVGNADGKLKVSYSYADNYIGAASSGKVGGLAGAGADAELISCYAAGFLMGSAGEAAGLVPADAAKLDQVYSVFNFDDITGLAATDFAAADSATLAADKYDKTGAVESYPATLTSGVAEREKRYGLVKNGTAVSVTNGAYYTYGEVSTDSGTDLGTRTSITHVTGKELATNTFAAGAKGTGALFAFGGGAGASGMVAGDVELLATPYLLAPFLSATGLSANAGYPYPTLTYAATVDEVTMNAALTHRNDWLSNDKVGEDEIDLFERGYDAVLAALVPSESDTVFPTTKGERWINQGKENEKDKRSVIKEKDGSYTVELPAAQEYDGFAFVGWFAPRDLFAVFADENSTAAQNAINAATAAVTPGESEAPYTDTQIREKLTELTGTFVSTKDATDGTGAAKLFVANIDVTQALEPATNGLANGAAGAYTIPSEKMATIRAYQRLYAVYREEPEIELFARIYDEKLQVLETNDAQVPEGEKDLGKRAKLIATKQEKDSNGKITTTFRIDTGVADAYTGYEFVGWFEPSALHTLTEDNIKEARSTSEGKQLTTTLISRLTDLLKNKKINDGKEKKDYVSIAEGRKLVLNDAKDAALMDMAQTYEVKDDGGNVTSTPFAYDETTQAYRRLYAVYRNTKPHTVTVNFRYLPMPTEADINKAVMDIYAGNLSTQIDETLKYEIEKKDKASDYNDLTVPIKNLTGKGYGLVAGFEESETDSDGKVTGTKIKTGEDTYVKMTNYKGWVVQIDQTDPDNPVVTDWRPYVNGDKTSMTIKTDKPYSYVVLYTYGQVDIDVKYVFHTSTTNGASVETETTNSTTRILEIETQAARDALLSGVIYTDAKGTLKDGTANADYRYIIKDTANLTAGSSAEESLSIEDQVKFSGFELRKITNDAVVGDATGRRALELHYYRVKYTLSYDLQKGIYNESGVGADYVGDGFKPPKSYYYGEEINGTTNTHGMDDNGDGTLKRKGYYISNWELTTLETTPKTSNYAVSKTGTLNTTVTMPAADANATVSWTAAPTSYRVELYYQDVTDPYTVANLSDNNYLLFSVTDDVEFTEADRKTLLENPSTRDILMIAYQHEGEISKDEHHTHLLDEYTYTEQSWGTGNGSWQSKSYDEISSIINSTTQTITDKYFYYQAQVSTTDRLGRTRTETRTYYCYFDAPGNSSTSKPNTNGNTYKEHSYFADLSDEQKMAFLEAISERTSVYVRVKTSTPTTVTVNDLFFAPDEARFSTGMDENGEVVVRLYYYRKKFTVVYCFKKSATSQTTPFASDDNAKNARDNLFKAITGQESAGTVSTIYETDYEKIVQEDSKDNTYGYMITMEGLYGASFSHWSSNYRWKHLEQTTKGGSNSYTVRLDRYWDEYSTGYSTIHYLALESSGDAYRLYFVEQSEADGATTYRTSVDENVFHTNTANSLSYFDLNQYEQYAASANANNIVFNTDGTVKMAMEGYKYWNYALTNQLPKDMTFTYENLSGGYRSDTDSYIRGLETTTKNQLCFNNGSSKYSNIFFIRDSFTVYLRNLSETSALGEEQHLYRSYLSELAVPSAADCPYGNGYVFQGWFTTSEFTIEDGNGNIVENTAARVTTYDETAHRGTGTFTDAYFNAHGGVTGKGIPMPAENTSFFAYWKPAEVTVTYHTLDPYVDSATNKAVYNYTAIYTQNVERNGRITADDPKELLEELSQTSDDLYGRLSTESAAGDSGIFYQIKDGDDITYEWEFEGWYYNDIDPGNPIRSDLTQKYNMNLAVSGNISLYARWKQTRGKMVITVIPRYIETGEEIRPTEESGSTTYRWRVTTDPVDIGTTNYTIYAKNDIEGYWPVLASYTFTVDGDKETIYMDYDRGEAWTYCIDSYVVYPSESDSDPIYIKIDSRQESTDSQSAQVAAPSAAQMTGYRFADAQIDFTGRGGYAPLEKPNDTSVIPHISALYTADVSPLSFPAMTGATVKLDYSGLTDYYYAGVNTATGVANKASLPATGSSYSATKTTTGELTATGNSYSLKELYTVTASDGSIYTYLTGTGSTVDLSTATMTASDGTTTTLPGGSYTVTAKLVLVKGSETTASAVLWTSGSQAFKITPYKVTLIDKVGAGNPFEDLTLYYEPTEEKFYSDKEMKDPFTEFVRGTNSGPNRRHAGVYYLVTGSGSGATVSDTMVLVVGNNGSFRIASGYRITGDITIQLVSDIYVNDDGTRIGTDIKLTDGTVKRRWMDLTDGKWYDAETGGNVVENIYA